MFHSAWPAGAQKGYGVDTGMGAEALVFVAQEHLQEARVDVGGLDGKAPKAAADGVGTQQLAIAVEDFGGGFSQGEREVCAVDPSVEGAIGRKDCNKQKR